MNGLYTWSIIAAALFLGASVCSAADRPNIGKLTKQGYRVVSVVSDAKKDDFVAFLEKGESIYICPLQFKREGVEFRSGPWTDYAACEQVTPRPENMK